MISKKILPGVFFISIISLISFLLIIIINSIFFSRPNTVETKAVEPSPKNMGTIGERIYQGEPVSAVDYPFSIALINGNSNTVNVVNQNYDLRKGFFCSGVLIDSKTVLTAAHCLINDQRNGYNIYNDVKIVYGLSTLFGTLNPKDSINNHLYNVISFSNLNPKDNGDDDIAYIKLSRPVAGYNTSKIVLPTKDQSYLYAKDIDISITGFGCQTNLDSAPSIDNPCDQGVLKKSNLTNGQ